MNPKDTQYTLTAFGQDAIDKVMVGVDEVCEAVATTLGPGGLPVMIDKGYTTSIIRDGVNVSLIVNPEDPFARNGATVIKEATKKQRDSVGDGTTCVAILTQAILKEALKMKAAGVNPRTFTKGLEQGAEKVVAKLESLAKPVKTLEQKIQIATISAEDAELGRMVAETVHKIGDEGVLTVEESKAAETYVEMQEGMQIDKGYTHQFMITDPERQVAILEDCAVLITDHPLNTVAEIGKFLDKVIFPNTKKVLFISPDIGLDFMQVLLGAKMSGQFLGLAMRAPGIGHMQVEQLQDICALTGATLISKDAGMQFDDQPFDVLGKAHRVVMNKISTIITGRAGHKEDVLNRISVIRAQMKEEDVSDYDIEQLKGRLAKLTNGVAVIKVAGQTEVEMKERKERAIDAVASTQSAVKHGLVAGGEVAYLACLDILDDKNLGEKILKDALKAPFKRLVENAGYDSGEKLSELNTPYGIAVDFERKKKMDNVDYMNKGFDVTDGKFKDMIKAGIIDSVAVPITAVKTAVSVAVQLSSLGAAIVLKNTKEEK